MTATRTLVFLSDPLTLAISLAVVLATIIVSIYSWRRGGYQRMHGLQELLRIIVVILVAVMFNQPEWVEEYQPEEKPAIAVLWDSTSSMETQDVLPNSFPSVAEKRSVSQNAITRAEAIQPLINPEAWQEITERLDVVIEPFQADSSEQGTNLFTPLSRAPDRFQNLLGVVLISDGDWNLGRPPVEAASELRVKKIPVFTVSAGSPTQLPDLELVNIDLPTFGIVGKGVRIPFTIESSLPRETVTTVTLKTSSGETLTKDVRVAAMSRTGDSILWKPSETGDYTVTIEIPEHPEETITHNNQRSAPISIREERLRVLIVESVPRWEYRYLRNALSRDPGVEVSCLLFHPGLSKPGGGSKDYLKSFPDSIEELSKYDVVFLGDVGCESGQLTEEQCRLVKGLVEHQASGLILMPGLQGRQMSLLETELEDLYPVVLDRNQPDGWGSRLAGRFGLTERGRLSLLTRLADTPAENAQVWENLPGFQWYSAVIRAMPGSDVLAVHAEVENEYGRLPLLVTKTFGAGKVLFMGTDGAWRWRMGVEDKYHYRFWGQVIRWMAYQRNMAKGESMRLFHTPDQPQIRQTMALHAHVMSPSGEPLQQGDVLARIEAPSGKIETVKLLAEGKEWGVFHGDFAPQEHGTHQITLTCRQTDAILETTFFVQGEAIEMPGRPARPEVLDEIARVTGGESVRPDELTRVIDSLAALPLPPLSIRRLQLWNDPVPAAVLIVLLAVFWVWRKATGLM